MWHLRGRRAGARDDDQDAAESRQDSAGGAPATSAYDTAPATGFPVTTGSAPPPAPTAVPPAAPPEPTSVPRSAPPPAYPPPPPAYPPPPSAPATDPAPPPRAAPGPVNGPAPEPATAAVPGPIVEPAPEAETVHAPDSGPDAGAAPATRATPAAQAAPEAAFPPPVVFGNPTLGSDPRGLPELAVAVPDTVLDGAGVGGLTIRGASIRGDGHRFEHGPRQDAMGIWAFPGGAPQTAEAILVCVADGVSSEPESHRGAEAACQGVRAEMASSYRTLLDPASGDHLAGLCNALVGRVSRRMAELAERTGLAPRSLSTTLVAAVIAVNPADPGRRRCVLFAVGDSPAYVLRNNAFERCFPDSHGGPISDTGTAALPSAYRTAATAVTTIGPDDMLLLCTDGLADPMRGPAVEEILLNWWGRGAPPSLPEFGWQLSFRAKSYADDRTAVCVWGR